MLSATSNDWLIKYLHWIPEQRKQIENNLFASQRRCRKRWKLKFKAEDMRSETWRLTVEDGISHIRPHINELHLVEGGLAGDLQQTFDKCRKIVRLQAGFPKRALEIKMAEQAG